MISGMDIEELDRAETELNSLLRKCEAVLQGGTLSVSRTTLMTNRVAALKTAVELVRRQKIGYDSAGVFASPIATTVSPFGGFFPAEDYHQDYLAKHPDEPYIVINDAPKVRELEKRFAGVYRR